MSTQTKPLTPKTRRNNDPSILIIGDEFQPVDPMAPYKDGGSTCANIRQNVEPCAETIGRFADKVSAPYVLARLIAMFQDLQIKASGQDGYKVTWEVALQHKATKHFVTFYDYKGGISYGSDVYGKTATGDFVSDVHKLLQALSNDRFPHPYDGCVVGEEA